MTKNYEWRRPRKATKKRRAKGDRGTEELKTVPNDKDDFVKYNKQYEYEPDDLDDDIDEPRTW